jgi:hypothetical protein
MHDLRVQVHFGDLLMRLDQGAHAPEHVLQRTHSATANASSAFLARS